MQKKRCCDICNKQYGAFISYGKMPIANNYNPKKSKFTYNCNIAVCFNDSLFKNINSIDKKILFNSNYPYSSSLSNNFSNYLKTTANELKKKFLKKRKNQNKIPFVVEVGSSDGIFLNEFKKNKFLHVGFEPTKNNHLSAKKRGVNSLNIFFNTKSSKYVLKKYGQADLIFSSNTIAHIEKINQTFKAIDILLNEKGYFIFENIYLFDLLKNNYFDQLYDEHTYTISVTTVNNLCIKFGFNLFKIKKINIQGGSLRYYITKNKKIKKQLSVISTLKKESKNLKLSSSVIRSFRLNNITLKNNLKSLINNLKKDKKIIVGIGASAKSTFLINFCSFDKSDIGQIYDNSINKKNLFIPGTNIKIKNQKLFTKDKFDYVIVFAWNHFAEIYNKYKQNKYMKNVKWIIPNNKIKIIG